MSSRDVAGIKLVAIDLDGTLLNDSKEVAEHTVAALKGLPRRGVRVVIASARPPRSVKRFHDLLGLDTLSIHYNGRWFGIGLGADAASAYP
jgi:HAD superfamily hydrolase (TIGR01484 family)